VHGEPGWHLSPCKHGSYRVRVHSPSTLRLWDKMSNTRFPLPWLEFSYPISQPE